MRSQPLSFAPAKLLRCRLVFLPKNLVRFRECLPRCRFFGCVSFAKHVKPTMIVCDFLGVSITTSLVEHSLELIGEQSSVACSHVHSPSVHNFLRQIVRAFQVLINWWHPTFIASLLVRLPLYHAKIE